MTEEQLNPNRCEICQLLSDTAKNNICRGNHKVIPDVSKQPEWCPKRRQDNG